MVSERRSPRRFRFCLKQALVAKGMSKRQLHKLSGIPYPMVIRLSKGEANPNWKTVVRLADALGVDPGEFFYKRWLKPPAGAKQP